MLVDGTPEAALLPELDRAASEPVFTKVRVNVFACVEIKRESSAWGA